MTLDFCHMDEIEDKLWQSLLLKAKCNLNYEKYFMEYQTISYPLKNLSGIVLSNSYPLALFVVYADSLKRNILPVSLAPIYFTENSNAKLALNKFYQEVIQCSKNLEENVFNNNRSISWLPKMNTRLAEAESDHEIEEFIIDLESSEEILFSRLSRNHKRTIKNSIEMGHQVFQISSESSQSDIDFYFNQYRKMHIQVSGRETRPIESFEFMKKLIYRGVSMLFVSMFQGEPISFLYCDSNREYSRGWSQVSKPNLGTKNFPRTLLEWTAIQTYKAKGRTVYHLGVHEKGSFDSITELQGFVEFKRRFGPTIIR